MVAKKKFGGKWFTLHIRTKDGSKSRATIQAIKRRGGHYRTELDDDDNILVWGRG